jgi:agmatine deiminase
MSAPAKTPRELGYRMPAEWEPHEATWIAWPHNPEDWPGKFEPIPWIYADIVRCLSAVERAEILVNDAEAEDAAWKMLELTGVSLEDVRFHRWPTDRVWTRDSGPIFVRQRETGAVGLTQWKFNAWAKYENWRNDVEIPARVRESVELPGWEPVVRGERVVLEGGSIDSNGQGVLLTTEECLLSEVQQRNPGLTRADLEQCFADYLGIDKVIWLGHGIVGDDTHGHVDDMSRFVAADTIVTAVEPDAKDENHEILAENLQRLQAATNQYGKPFRVVTLPMPDPVIFEGQRLPASYANFYIANRLVLAPTFSDEKDRLALDILTSLFPGRKVVGIPCRDFIWGLGALHCMTQQQPASIVP